MNKFLKLFLLVSLLSFSAISKAETTEEIKQSAEQGSALGQAKLASLYILGRSVEVNHRRAAQLMEKSARQGFIEAQVVIAAMYDMGEGVARNKEMATRWYEKAAKQGHGTSLAILGKNSAAKGSVKFDYKKMRFTASRQIPKKYALNILMMK